MDLCKHTGWLRLSTKERGHILEVSDRAQRLLDSLPRPESQFPSVIALLGNVTKRLAMQQLGVEITTPNTSRGHGEVHLSFSPATETGERPLLIADSDIPSHNRRARPRKPPLCHEITSRPLPQSQEDAASPKVEYVADRIYSRMLLPFADVVCFFADDVGGLHNVARRLVAWLDLGRSSNSTVCPWLVIVVDDGEETVVRQTFLDMLRAKTSTGVSEIFQGIRVVSLRHISPKTLRRGPPSVRWDVLCNELSYMAETKRIERRLASSLFSANHLAAFLRYAVDKQADVVASPLDFLAVSRIDNPVAPDLETHLAGFLRGFRSLELLRTFAVPVIASSFLLDHYPPGMHRKSTHQRFSKLIETDMARRSRPLRLGESAASLHRQLVGQFRDDWPQFQSENTCYHCLRRRPQFFPVCGHGWCMNCVAVFGVRSQDDPWLVQIDGCLLCGRELKMTVRMKPDTATARVLCFDGGGTRGKYPLMLLKQLQDSIDLPNHPVQQNFDIIYGTSSGAITAGALCLNGWTVEECIASFESLASHAFTPRRLPAVPLVRPLLRVLMSLPLVPALVRLAALLAFDSRYPSWPMEEALRRVFGAEKSIVDYSPANATGTMVGMTQHRSKHCVTRTKDRDKHPRIKLLHSYFTPWRIKGLGTFQDGGLVANNPSSIALREIASLYPTTPDPSIFVSLGTGSTQGNESQTSASRWPWRDSFPLRLVRALWSLGSTERTWQQVIAHKNISHTGEFFRFDVSFPGTEPALDDLSELSDVEDGSENSRGTFEGLPELARLVLCIRAELFVFELSPTQPFRFVDGEYECLGHIRCRLGANSDAFVEFMSQLDTACASFLIGDRTLAGGFYDRSPLGGDGHFCKEVRFRVASREEPVAITLWESPDEGCNISGSPFNLRRLVREQKLDECFGSADHRKRSRAGEGEIDARRKRQKR
ncbi:FabD/lysophospholipase-like protein [Colletotrichum falcatum]|nr:FabD/lysophospholipase-like protein [Colletotrichum falcatum]